MRKNLLLGLALASAMTLTTAAMAAGQDGGPKGDWHGGHRGGHHGMMMGMEKLNLSDDQKASIKQIVKGSFTQNKAQFDNLRKQRVAFEAMTPDQVGYQQAATSLAQTEAAATQQRVQQRAQIRAQIYALLTPAQKQQLAQLKADRQARMEQWKEFRAQHPASSGSTAQ